MMSSGDKSCWKLEEELGLGFGVGDYTPIGGVFMTP